VQSLSTSQEIHITGPVLDAPAVATILEKQAIKPIERAQNESMEELMGAGTGVAEDRIEDSRLFENGLLDQQAVRSLFHLHRSGTRDVHPLLWAILMYLQFLGSVKDGPAKSARPRVMGVLDPLKLVITNLDAAHEESLEFANHPKNPDLGARPVPCPGPGRLCCARTRQ